MSPYSSLRQQILNQLTIGHQRCVPLLAYYCEQCSLSTLSAGIPVRRAILRMAGDIGTYNGIHAPFLKSIFDMTLCDRLLEFLNLLLVPRRRNLEVLRA